MCPAHMSQRGSVGVRQKPKNVEILGRFWRESDIGVVIISQRITKVFFIIVGAT